MSFGAQDFTFSEQGFSYILNNNMQKINWLDVELITSYKLDLFTTDEICVDIIFKEGKLTFPESSPGWYQLFTKLKEQFPSISKNFPSQIMQPPFATNYTVLFERDAREVIEDSTFEL